VKTFKLLYAPLACALAMLTGSVIPAAAHPEEPAAVGPWPPEDTHGKYVSAPNDFYTTEVVPACGSKVTLAYSDVREVQYKAEPTDDGGLLIRYRGGITLDITREDGAFIDELDISGRTTETWSKDGLKLHLVMHGPSLLYAPTEVESAALVQAGLPTFLYFKEGKFVGDVQFSQDPAVPVVSAEVTRNRVEDARDVCKMLDRAVYAKNGTGYHASK
jgi:hypothetical protein